MKVKAVFTFTLLGAFFASAALSQDVPVVSVINVKTTNPQGYTQYLADHPQIMSSLGAQAGGTCLTVSGHRYPNQAFAWTIFPNAAAAFKAARMYSQAPANPELDALRENVSSEFYAILKPFTKPSGWERRFQMVINDVPGFVKAATALEKSMQDAGHPVEIGIFMPMGAGKTKAGLIDIRIFAVEPEIGGALAQHVLSGQHDRAAMGAMQSFIESVELDTFEDCKQVFTAE